MLAETELLCSKLLRQKRMKAGEFSIPVLHSPAIRDDGGCAARSPVLTLNPQPASRHPSLVTCPWPDGLRREPEEKARASTEKGAEVLRYEQKREPRQKRKTPGHAGVCSPRRTRLAPGCAKSPHRKQPFGSATVGLEQRQKGLTKA